MLYCPALFPSVGNICHPEAGLDCLAVSLVTFSKDDFWCPVFLGGELTELMK